LLHSCQRLLFPISFASIYLLFNCHHRNKVMHETVCPVDPWAQNIVYTWNAHINQLPYIPITSTQKHNSVSDSHVKYLTIFFRETCAS
jgi:hypothetical protein